VSNGVALPFSRLRDVELDSDELSTSEMDAVIVGDLESLCSSLSDSEGDTSSDKEGDAE